MNTSNCKNCEEEEEEVPPQTLRTAEPRSATFIEGIKFAQENFRAKPDDIFLCSFPKSGTTWLKALSFATATRTRFHNSENPLLTKSPHDCIPFLEVYFNKNPTMLESLDPPLWSTHIPYSSLPKSIIDSGCKIVYICRDPKDAFVSLWHFRKRIESHNPGIIFEEAFEMFCKGSSFYAPYWEHFLGYWKASLEFPDRVLFLKYEEMMEDTALYLKRLAEFIGHPFSLQEENEGVVQNIVDLCSFENLSNLEVNKSGKRDCIVVNNNAFFRKGKVGDWKNYLTSEMAERLDKIIEEKFAGSGFKF
ncbi:Sulfotransferase [Melia azedarach]|uniref:Sulfotransferase n=1 Tax=Melia azedarach TaxID=155640 RepID=A0ACC1X2B6_MELAZ|nr:Sulfotransferase [Melia azedarach]